MTQNLSVEELAERIRNSDPIWGQEPSAPQLDQPEPAVAAPKQVEAPSEPLDPLESASNALQELLETSECSLSLGDVADLALTHGLAPHQLLGSAEESENCWVDYATGQVRCLPAEETEEEQDHEPTAN